MRIHEFQGKYQKHYYREGFYDQNKFHGHAAAADGRSPGLLQ